MKLKITILLALTVLLNCSCSDFLDLEPKNKVTADRLFSDPKGVQAYMANLYYQLPIEDFTFDQDKGFNYNYNGAQNFGINPSVYTDEAVSSEYWMFIGWDINMYQWWNGGYKLNRDVNVLEAAIPTLDITDVEKKSLIGECAFIKAYNYFALVRRYGGVPLVKELQEYEGDVEILKVPRSTEKESWDYVLELFDKAIENLPQSWSDNQRRATVWAAYAYKSRAALHAASIAKYWNEYPFSGEAVDKGYVGGMTADDANRYYEACIKASEALMNDSPYSLHKPNPANPEEAARNYQEIFEDPSTAPEEVIFAKGYAQPGAERGHSTDFWNNPNQTANGASYPGRTNPTLDLADLYENYDNPGHSAPIVTTEDGDLSDVSGYNPARKYLHFDNPMDIFKGKDARLFGTLIVPSSQWKNTTIIIQGGMIKPDGSYVTETEDSYTMPNGKKYYTFGASVRSEYSGFENHPNMTRTGFLRKKFLNEKSDVAPRFFESTTSYIDIRYAEILLNYAEAVVESNYSANGVQTRAAEAINALRKRAGHTKDIPLTLDNVLRERRVELAFENRRHWDLMRRREYQKEFNGRERLALMPVIDLRGEKPQYIFVRKLISRDGMKFFEPKAYYVWIPGTETTGITQNPLY
ncbi:RagB/SusD family nutrient uptake outer membrane protein [Bacteroides cellulosilyticus]|jgi:hypothetical protein|uniref:RagB/SusD family nutrient uptake outer membrane protein n=1 Tax=Bacteroides cellulosilyticus TaxID=246787 RepID=UPI00189D419A|nr:RagB/SusD family nutrient uptake outer membrane protein [Bacteroides cellulosilyticus]